MKQGISVDVDVSKLLNTKVLGDFHLKPHVDVDKILPHTAPPKPAAATEVKTAPGRKGAIKWIK